MKLSGHMEETKISYKAVDPRCDVDVRELNRHQAARRLITNNKRKIASAGLVVSNPDKISAGALVEIDLSFPGIPLIYRSRGVVDWIDDKKTKMGVLVFGMDKVDPNAVPPQPTAQTPPTEDISEASPESVPPETESEPIEETTPAPVETQPTAAEESTEDKLPGLKMPEEEDVAELFSGLVDAEIDVRINTDKELKTKRFAVIAEYQNDDGHPVLLVAADVALVNFLGSALVMLPKEKAEDANKNNAISEEIQESFQEICNISASLINDAGNAHVRFSTMHLTKSGNIPEETTQIIENHSNKVDFAITIPGYGSGKLAILDATWK